MSRLTDVSLSLLVKLGSIAVHAEELIEPGWHKVDAVVIRALLADPEFITWRKQMGVLLPKKR